MADPVVLVFPTIMDGTVVRWYGSEDAAKYGREMASASRTGVSLNFAPREVAMAAYDAHEVLAADRNADMSDLATHRRKSFPSGEIEPVPAGHEAGGGVAPASVRVTVDDRFGGAPR